MLSRKESEKRKPAVVSNRRAWSRPTDRKGGTNFAPCRQHRHEIGANEVWRLFIGLLCEGTSRPTLTELANYVSVGPDYLLLVEDVETPEMVGWQRKFVAQLGSSLTT